MDLKRPEPVPLVGVSWQAGRDEHAVKPPEVDADGTLPLARAVPGRATRSHVLVAILAATLAACGDRDGSTPGPAAPSGTTAVVAAQEPERATGADPQPTTTATPTAEPVTTPASTAPKSTSAANDDPDQPSAAPPTAEPAPEPATDTDTSQDRVTKSTVAAGDDPDQPSAAPPTAEPAPEPATDTDTSQDGVSTGGLRGPPPDPPQPAG